MLPNSITERLARAWPALPISAITPTVGGFSHHSALGTIGARRCVLKAAEHPPRRGPAPRGARAHAATKAPACRRRRWLACSDDSDWTIMVMPMLPGASGVTTSRAARTGAARGGLALARACSRRFINRRCGLPGDALLAANRTSQVRAQLAHHPLGTQLRRAYRQPGSPGLARRQHQPGAWRVRASTTCCGIHPPRPWSIGNRAGWGNPHLDLAWVWWTLRWRQAPGALWQAFEQYHQIMPHTRVR
ncbi:MAG: hypothetical protein IPP13_00030 [Kouleothrix sp.]|nr:hypothetical protein [Kouleothrix sp.]